MMKLIKKDLNHKRMNEITLRLRTATKSLLGTSPVESLLQRQIVEELLTINTIWWYSHPPKCGRVPKFNLGWYE